MKVLLKLLRRTVSWSEWFLWKITQEKWFEHFSFSVSRRSVKLGSKVRVFHQTFGGHWVTEAPLSSTSEHDAALIIWCPLCWRQSQDTEVKVQGCVCGISCWKCDQTQQSCGSKPSRPLVSLADLSVLLFADLFPLLFQRTKTKYHVSDSCKHAALLILSKQREQEQKKGKNFPHKSKSIPWAFGRGRGMPGAHMLCSLSICWVDFTFLSDYSVRTWEILQESCL